MLKKKSKGTGFPIRETPVEGFVGVTSHKHEEALHLHRPSLYTVVRTLIWVILTQRKKSFRDSAGNPSALWGIFPKHLPNR